MNLLTVSNHWNECKPKGAKLYAVKPAKGELLMEYEDMVFVVMYKIGNRPYVGYLYPEGIDLESDYYSDEVAMEEFNLR